MKKRPLTANDIYTPRTKPGGLSVKKVISTIKKLKKINPDISKITQKQLEEFIKQESTKKGQTFE